MILLIWLVSIALGGCVGATKGRGAEGVALGVILGPLGVLIAAVLPRSPREEAKRQIQIAEEQTRLAMIHAAQIERAKQREQRRIDKRRMKAARRAQGARG